MRPCGWGGLPSALGKEGGSHSHLPLFFECWQEINSPKSEFCFSLHPSVPGAQASPMPTLPLPLSGINHSFHLLAAVDTILTRCEMQLRNNSGLTVFFFSPLLLLFFIAIWWMAHLNLSHQPCSRFVPVNVILCLHWFRRKLCRDPQPPHGGCTTEERACPPSSMPFLPGPKNYMLTGENYMLALVELHRRLGVICQVLRRRGLPTPSQEGIGGETFC